MTTNARFIGFCVTVACVLPASAQTGTWSSPSVLSTGGQGWESAAAIAGNGTSVAIWDERTSQDHIWSRAKASTGQWGSVTQVSPAVETNTAVLPAVRISAAGFATAVWSDESGVWTADRPPASKWNPAQLLVPGASSPIFAMNPKGDAAVAWTVGGPTDPDSMVFAVVRPAGGVWSSQQLIASGGHLASDSVGIGGNGAAIVTWESYDSFCFDEECELSNFVLHASRQASGSSTWADSGPLLGPDDDSHNAQVALDSSGRAMLVGYSSAEGYTAATQGNAGGSWSSFNSAVDPQVITIVSGLAANAVGNVTMVYETINLFTSQAMAISASITNNVWSPPVVLSGADENVSQIYFALAPSGAAMAVWLNSTGTPVVRAIVRAADTGTWSVPATISVAGSSEISPEAAAVNSAGQAIAIYSGYNASDVHTEYAVNYQPN